jgi:hypothetical protein
MPKVSGLEAPDPRKNPSQQTPRRGIGKLQPSPESGSVGTNLQCTELAFRSRDKGRECPSFPAACSHHVPALVFNCAVRRDADNRGCSSRFSQQHWMLVAARREVIVEERLHCHTLTRKLRCLVMMCHLR